MKKEWIEKIARLEQLAAPSQPAERKSLCQILQVEHDDAPRWKWRYTDAEGRVTESAQTFTYHYECVAAARQVGYRPEHRWLPPTAIPALP
jgi:hypothetical protein